MSAGTLIPACSAIQVAGLPTTAGTAAEVTINYVITDDERKKKMTEIAQ